MECSRLNGQVPAKGDWHSFLVGSPPMFIQTQPQLQTKQTKKPIRLLLLPWWLGSILFHKFHYCRDLQSRQLDGRTGFRGNRNSWNSTSFSSTETHNFYQNDKKYRIRNTRSRCRKDPGLSLLRRLHFLAQLLLNQKN